MFGSGKDKSTPAVAHAAQAGASSKQIDTLIASNARWKVI